MNNKIQDKKLASSSSSSSSSSLSSFSQKKDQTYTILNFFHRDSLFNARSKFVHLNRAVQQIYDLRNEAKRSLRGPSAHEWDLWVQALDRALAKCWVHQHQALEFLLSAFLGGDKDSASEPLAGVLDGSEMRMGKSRTAITLSLILTLLSSKYEQPWDKFYRPALYHDYMPPGHLGPLAVSRMTSESKELISSRDMNHSSLSRKPQEVEESIKKKKATKKKSNQPQSSLVLYSSSSDESSDDDLPAPSVPTSLVSPEKPLSSSSGIDPECIPVQVHDRELLLKIQDSLQAYPAACHLPPKWMEICENDSATRMGGLRLIMCSERVIWRETILDVFPEAILHRAKNKHTVQYESYNWGCEQRMTLSLQAQDVVARTHVSNKSSGGRKRKRLGKKKTIVKRGRQNRGSLECAITPETLFVLVTKDRLRIDHEQHLRWVGRHAEEWGDDFIQRHFMPHEIKLIYEASAAYKSGETRGMGSKEPVARPSLLFLIKWREIILDESHVLKGICWESSKVGLAGLSLAYRGLRIHAITSTPTPEDTRELASQTQLCRSPDPFNQVAYWSSIREAGPDRRAQYKRFLSRFWLRLLRSQYPDLQFQHMDDTTRYMGIQMSRLQCRVFISFCADGVKKLREMDQLEKERVQRQNEQRLSQLMNRANPRRPALYRFAPDELFEEREKQFRHQMMKIRTQMEVSDISLDLLPEDTLKTLLGAYYQVMDAFNLAFADWFMDECSKLVKMEKETEKDELNGVGMHSRAAQLQQGGNPISKREETLARELDIEQSLDYQLLLTTNQSGTLSLDKKRRSSVRKPSKSATFDLDALSLSSSLEEEYEEEEREKDTEGEEEEREERKKTRKPRARRGKAKVSSRKRKRKASVAAQDTDTDTNSVPNKRSRGLHAGGHNSSRSVLRQPQSIGKWAANMRPQNLYSLERLKGTDFFVRLEEYRKEQKRIQERRRSLWDMASKEDEFQDLEDEFRLWSASLYTRGAAGHVDDISSTFQLFSKEHDGLELTYSLHKMRHALRALLHYNPMIWFLIRTLVHLHRNNPGSKVVIASERVEPLYRTMDIMVALGLIPVWAYQYIPRANHPHYPTRARMIEQFQSPPVPSLEVLIRTYVEKQLQAWMSPPEDQTDAPHPIFLLNTIRNLIDEYTVRVLPPGVSIFRRWLQEEMPRTQQQLDKKSADLEGEADSSLDDVIFGSGREIAKPPWVELAETLLAMPSTVYGLIDDYAGDVSMNVNNIFFLSRAGGTGINLGAADYVFLLTPCWSADIEEQMLNRCVAHKHVCLVWKLLSHFQQREIPTISDWKNGHKVDKLHKMVAFRSKHDKKRVDRHYRKDVGNVDDFLAILRGKQDIIEQLAQNLQQDSEEETSEKEEIDEVCVWLRNLRMGLQRNESRRSRVRYGSSSSSSSSSRASAPPPWYQLYDVDKQHLKRPPATFTTERKGRIDAVPIFAKQTA
jgi:hypothetical protein